MVTHIPFPWRARWWRWRAWPAFVLGVSSLLCSGALAGCAGFASRTAAARAALDAGDPERALSRYNEELGVADAEGQPPEVGGDNALLLLDRSMVLQQLQRYEASSTDLQVADKQIEMLDFSRSTADEIGRYLFSDDVGPYRARPFEKLLINTMNMVNYLARGDLNGARIEARRLAVMQKYLQEQVEGSDEDSDGPVVGAGRDLALLGPGCYLAGFTFERSGNDEEALRYYDEALAATSYRGLGPPVSRLAEVSSYRSPRIKALLDDRSAEGASSDEGSDEGELLLVLGYGRVPALEAVRVPIGLALTYAAGGINPDQEAEVRRMAAQGLVTWVNYPELAPAPPDYGEPGVWLDGQPVETDEAVAIDRLLRAAYEAERGQVVASAITRMIARGAAGALAGVAAASASKKGKKKKNNAGLGMFAAMVVQAAGVAADTPDTRSWSTLPARLSFVRLRLPAGLHRLRISVLGKQVEREVNVEAGGWSVLSVTDLRQPPFVVVSRR